MSGGKAIACCHGGLPAARRCRQSVLCHQLNSAVAAMLPRVGGLLLVLPITLFKCSSCDTSGMQAMRGGSDSSGLQVAVNTTQRSSHDSNIGLGFDDETDVRGSETNTTTLTDEELCNESARDNAHELGQLIANETSEVNALNATLQNLRDNVLDLTWSFINNHEENVGGNAITVVNKYLASMKYFVSKLKSLDRLIREYNCAHRHLNTNVAAIPVQDHEEKLRNDQNAFHKFKFFHDLINRYYKWEALKAQNNNLTELYNSWRRLPCLREAVQNMALVNNLTVDMLQDVKALSNFTQANGMDDVYITSFTAYFQDVAYWEYLLENGTKEYENASEYLRVETFRITLQEYVQPAVQGIIFFVGIVGNGALLFIFGKHASMRTAANLMLINLAVVDTLNLIVNIPAFYFYALSSAWSHGPLLCKAYKFLRQLCIGVSAYSIVFISLQRFFALSRVVQDRRCGCRLPATAKSVLILFSVWLIGCLIALPHTMHAGVYNGNCYGAPDGEERYLTDITLLDLLVVCVIPLAVIAALSLVSARRLKTSVQQFPGESVGVERVIRARIVSSNVLVILTVVSAVSYLPFYIFFFLNAWAGLSMDPRTYYTLFMITYTLLFSNSCFNPIALFMISRKFRSYFKRYLMCYKEIDIDLTQKRSSTGTTSTIVESKL
ncbi:uncharacterized protein [Periplaneta americana]|uniref:uncharacterized protein n=1 Tax=Periplaneta americana TaxID=6978 RepID=UPI0037E93EA0